MRHCFWAGHQAVVRSITAALAAAILVSFFAISVRASAATHRRSPSYVHTVRPYVTKRGTFVQPHIQTNPNGTRRDNFSTKGNVNPFTGKPGTRTP